MVGQNNDGRIFIRVFFQKARVTLIQIRETIVDDAAPLLRVAFVVQRMRRVLIAPKFVTQNIGRAMHQHSKIPIGILVEQIFERARLQFTHALDARRKFVQRFAAGFAAFNIHINNVFAQLAQQFIFQFGRMRKFAMEARRHQTADERAVDFFDGPRERHIDDDALFAACAQDAPQRCRAAMRRVDVFERVRIFGTLIKTVQAEFAVLFARRKRAPCLFG